MTRRGNDVSEAKRTVLDSTAAARGDPPMNRRQERIQRAEARKSKKQAKRKPG